MKFIFNVILILLCWQQYSCYAKKLIGNFVFYGRGQSKFPKYWNNVFRVKGSIDAKVYLPPSEEFNQPLMLYLPGKKSRQYSKLNFYVGFEEKDFDIDFCTFQKIKSEIKLVAPTVDELIAQGYTCQSIGLSCKDLKEYDFDANSEEWLAKVDLRLFIEQDLRDTTKPNAYQIENFDKPSNEWKECSGDIIKKNIKDIFYNYYDFVLRNYGDMPVYILMGNTMFLTGTKSEIVVKNGVTQKPYVDVSWTKEATNGKKVTYFADQVYEDDTYKKKAVKFEVSDATSDYGYSIKTSDGILSPPEGISFRILPTVETLLQIKYGQNLVFNVTDFLRGRNCEIPTGEESEVLIDLRSIAYENPTQMLNNEEASFTVSYISTFIWHQQEIRNTQGDAAADAYKEELYFYSMTLHHTYPNSLSDYKLKNLEYNIKPCNLTMKTHQDMTDWGRVSKWPIHIDVDYSHRYRNAYSTINVIPMCTSIFQDSSCKIINYKGDTLDLEDGRYCSFVDGKLYKSSSNNCTPMTNESLLIKEETSSSSSSSSPSYVAGTFNTDIKGMIFTCTNELCQQLFSTNYLFVNEDIKALYHCDIDGICTKQNKIIAGYYVNGISGASSKTPLIYCADANINTCIFTDAKEGFLINASSQNVSLIKCGSNACWEIESGASYSKSPSFVDASNKSNLIICTKTVCTSAPGSTIKGYAYIDGSKVSDTCIITCTDEGCTSTDYSNDLTRSPYLHFIDATNPRNVITCNSYGCSSEEGVTTASHAYIYGKSNEVILCKPHNCSKETGCHPLECNVFPGNTVEGFAYIDAYNDLKKTVILCRGGSSSACYHINLTKTLNTNNVYYTDGYDSNYIITCLSTGCSSAIGLTLCSSVTEMENCKYKRADGEEIFVDPGYYCFNSDGKIYYTTTSGNCIAADGEEEIMFFNKEEDTETLYKRGTFEEDKGVIYTCSNTNSNSDDAPSFSCTQMYQTHVLNESKQTLYSCGEEGLCTRIFSNHVGFYLAGHHSTSDGKNTALIQCKEEKSVISCQNYPPTQGYYVDASQKRHIIKCTGDTCTSYDNGYYIVSIYFLNTADPKYLINCTKVECTLVEGKKGYYINSGQTGYKDRVIQCDGTICKYIETNYGYYYDSANPDNISTNKTLLIKCESNICYSTDFVSDGYYLNSGSFDDTDRLIKCKGFICTLVGSSVGYYMNADTSNYNNPLIQCTEKSCILTGPSSRTPTTWGYLINNANIDTGGTHYLIDCVNVCKEIIPLPGYYFNGGLDRDMNKIFKCDHTNGCQLMTLESQVKCEKSGQMIQDGDQLKLCTSKEASEALVLPLSNGQERYETIQVEEAGDFPGADAGYNVIRVGTYGSMILKEKVEGIRTCVDISGETACVPKDIDQYYCIKNNKLYYTNSQYKCREMRVEELSKYHNVFFKNEYQLTASPGNSDTYFAYNCQMIGNNKIHSCELMVGYSFAENGNIINCKGWKGEKCESVNDYYLNDCQKGDEGKIGKDGKLCFGKNGFPLPKDKEITLAFIPTKINTIYSKGKGEVTILTINSEKVAVTTLPDDGIIRFFINQNYQSKDQNSLPLIKCTGSTCNGEKNPATSATTEVYFMDGSDNRNLITCTASSGCTSIPISQEEGSEISHFYIDGTDPNNLIECTSDDGCTMETSTPGIYISNNNGVLINCSSGEEEGCSYIKSNTSCSSVTDKGNVDFEEGVSIKICASPEMEENKGWKIFDITSSGKYYLITQTLASSVFSGVGDSPDDSIFVETSTTGIKLIKNPPYGYYKNGDTTETDSYPYLQCDVNGCRGISISEDEVCTSETVGKLIGIADHPEICLSDGNMVSLETNDQQFIVYNPALNIFNLTENQYASIFVSLEKVTLLETDDDEDNIVYQINTDDNSGEKPLVMIDGPLYTYVTNEADPATTVYYIDRLNPLYLITCQGSQCQSWPFHNGYYLNAGQDKDNYPILLCIKTMGCMKVEELSDECSMAGEVIQQLGDDPKIYFCTTSTNEDKIEIKSEATTSSASPVYIEIKNNNLLNEFGIEDKESDIQKFKIENNGRVILLTKAKLPGCTEHNYECITSACSGSCSTTGDGQYCMGNDSILRYTSWTNASQTEYQCQAIGYKPKAASISSSNSNSSSVNSSYALYFFDKDYREITTLTADKPVNYVYNCEFDRTTQLVSTCTPVYGTFTEGDITIECNEWTEEFCTFFDKNGGEVLTPKPTPTSTPTSSSISPSPSPSPSTSSEYSTLPDENKDTGTSAAPSFYQNALLFTRILICITLSTAFLYIQL